MPLATTKASASAYGLGFTSGKQVLGPYLAAINATNGSSLFPVPLKTNGTVFAIESDGAGGVYVGGSFTTINDQPRNRLAYINSSGSVTTWNPSVNSSVFVIKRLGSNIYFGGQFTVVGGQTRNRVAAVDTAGTLLGWNPNVSSGAVYAMTTIGVNVYFGGNFNTVSGTSRFSAAGMNTSNSFLTGWNPNVYTTSGGGNPGLVNSLSSIGTNIYIFGNFSSILGNTREGAGGVSTGNTILTWNPNLDSGTNTGNGVTTSAVISDKIYFGGHFSIVAGRSRTNLACMDTAGNEMGWSPNPNGQVFSIFAASNRILVGGEFTTISGLPRPYYAAFSLIPSINTGGNLLEENVFPNGRVRAISADGSNVFIGGDFLDAAR